VAKRRRHPDSDNDANAGPGGDDPLGKLWQRYEVNFASAVAACAVMACFGVGSVIYALSSKPYSLIWLLIGLALLLFSVALLGANAFNAGRQFEVRKHGVRFKQAGVVTEILWEDIVDIDVDRLNQTTLGPATIRTRSKDAVSPSGPLTNTEWEVTIQGRDGTSIRLPRLFMRTVRDPKKLISQLRLRAGI
jgi:hypothetical protein